MTMHYLTTRVKPNGHSDWERQILTCNIPKVKA